MTSQILPWQIPVWEFVLKRYQQKRLPSAFLFEGAKGIGKTIFSHALTQLLLCQSEHRDKSCEKCHACLLLKSKTHPDLISIVGEGSSKIIKVDQIRALSEEVFKTSYFQGGYRVVMIEAAHNLNIAAANSLLKTLEEAPLKVFFILLTDSPHRISATIRSRCETIKFAKPSRELARIWLKAQLDPEIIEQYPVEFLLRLTHGSPLEAKALVDKKMLHWREALMSDLAGVIFSDIDPLSLAEKYKILDQAVLLFWIKTIVVDWIRLKMDAKERITHVDKYDLLIQCMSGINTLNLFAYLDRLYRLEERMNQFNLNNLLIIDEIFCGVVT